MHSFDIPQKMHKKILSRQIKIYDSFVGHFLKFFHVWIFVFTGGYRYFLNIFTYGFRFSRVQNDEFSSRRCPHSRFYFVYGCGGEVHRKWNGSPPFHGLCLFLVIFIFQPSVSLSFFGHCVWGSQTFYQSWVIWLSFGDRHALWWRNYQNIITTKQVKKSHNFRIVDDLIFAQPY